MPRQPISDTAATVLHNELRRTPCLALALLATAGSARAEDPGHDHGVDEFTVVGERRHETQRGPSDLQIDVRTHQGVATPDAADALELAPGLVISRVGSDLQPPQVFLRGFDARHGQDIAFSVDGMPLNQVGNVHGHGLVDFGFLIPEVIGELRVQEGPADPAQGDFAVAGSIAVRPSLAEPGLMLKGEGGSFGHGRAVIGWRAPISEGTFAIAEVLRTNGYGANRDGQRASALVRAEGDLPNARFSVLTGVYGTDYRHAGLVRRTDVDAGRIGLFDTQDASQSGAFRQAFVTATLSGEVDDDTVWDLHASLASRGMRLRNNFTGFLTDDRRPGESPHDQRGDLLDMRYAATTATVGAHARRHLFRGGETEADIEVGVNGRLDTVQSTSHRLRSVDLAPYRVEQDYELDQTNVGLFAGLMASGWAETLIVRAGGRADAFTYGLTDRCGAKDAWFFGAVTDDVNCPAIDRNGTRLREQSRAARGLALSPRASAELKLAPEWRLLAAGGRGIRSLEATALSNGEDAPFGDLWSSELGAMWTHAGSDWWGQQRLVGFTTHVSRDLLFDEEQGANIAAGSTARWGVMAQSETHVGPIVQSTAFTYTYAVFGDELPPNITSFRSDRLPGMLIPYVPPIVVRSDWSARISAGPIALRPGLTFTYLSSRPLPQSERSSPVFTVDAGVRTRTGPVELALTATNLLNARYPLAEYNFSSYFPDASDTAYPTRVPSRQVSPGAPRAVFASLTLWPDLGRRGDDA